MVVDVDELTGPLARRTVRHGYSDVVVVQDEVFFAVVVAPFELDVSGHTEEERLTMTRHRWWTREELAATTEEVWPSSLLELWERFDRGAASVDLGEQEESTVPSTGRTRVSRVLPRYHWARRSEQLDPVRDSHEISLHVSAYDFPWDNLQALSFALFRTYAVPSIGRLLDETGEFTRRVQKRYDDTGILLEEVQKHGFAHRRGRAAVRRINQMHGRYDISNDDLRYVLATFVVVPKRWMDDYGFRSLPRTRSRRPPTTTSSSAGT